MLTESLFVAVPKGKTVKDRLHLDIRPAGRSDEAEVQQLLALVARRADVGEGKWPWALLAGPEGNEFCVLGSG